MVQWKILRKREPNNFINTVLSSKNNYVHKLRCYNYMTIEIQMTEFLRFEVNLRKHYMEPPNKGHLEAECLS